MVYQFDMDLDNGYAWVCSMTMIYRRVCVWRIRRVRDFSIENFHQPMEWLYYKIHIYWNYSGECELCGSHILTHTHSEDSYDKLCCCFFRTFPMPHWDVLFVPSFAITACKHPMNIYNNFTSVIIHTILESERERMIFPFPFSHRFIDAVVCLASELNTMAQITPVGTHLFVMFHLRFIFRFFRSDLSPTFCRSRSG